MKLTDEDRLEWVEYCNYLAANESTEAIVDAKELIALIKSEQAAWQEVAWLQNQNNELQHRDKVVSLTNETLGRYVHEGKSEIKQLREENERLNNEMDSILTLLEDRNPTAHELLISKHHKIIDLEKENELLKDKSDQAFRIMLSATSDNERLRQEIERLKRYKAYFDDLYGEGLEVANLHQNGDLEPLDNFLDSAQAEFEGVQLTGEGTE